jgi:hypothetical protein
LRFFRDIEIGYNGSMNGGGESPVLRVIAHLGAVKK